jgi:type I restriction enzyme M protein
LSICYRNPNKREQATFEKAIASGHYAACNREQAQLRTSSYADLYVYLFLHVARFLKPGGRMGIITSNAWLDVNYGFALQKFLCDRFKIVAVVESRCEPWFTEAAVNTVLTVIERCDATAERDTHIVPFVKVKKRLADLTPSDPQAVPLERWDRLDKTVVRIERAGRKWSKTVPLGVITEEDDDFRIRLARQGELRVELEREGKTVKWGRLLRAPEVFFQIAKTQKLCLLRDVALPKRGGVTRINEFFYVDSATAAKFDIELEYLLPLIKSPKDSNCIEIPADELELRAFVCRRSKEELRKLNHNGALAYITWGEQQKYSTGNDRGVPWPQGTWVKNRKPGWYALPDSETNPSQIFFTKAQNDAHFHRFAREPLIPDQRLYYLAPKSGMDAELLSAILNSSVCALFTEIFGPVTMGEGVLELRVEDARDYLLVPDVRGVSPKQRKFITDAFAALCQRPIGSVFDEVKQSDWQALDRAVLSAIGLDPKQYLQPIYEGLCELVSERMELGRQRGNARKTKARKVIAEREIFTQVLA